MSLPLVSVIILGYNSKKYIRWCFEAIFAQSYPNFEVIYVDNASSDDSLNLVKSLNKSRTLQHGIKPRRNDLFYSHPSPPQVEGCSGKVRDKKITIIANKENLGYAGGQNIGIKNSSGEFVLCLNPDIILDKDYIKNIVELFLKNSKIGAITGRLLKFKINTAGTIEKTNIIDSCGLTIFKSHRVIERGGGEIDKGQYSQTERIFGVSGAAPIFRKSALENICKHSHKAFITNSYCYFDEDFFSYKEDVDLSFRLLHAGMQSWFEPKVLAWHHRWETGSQEKEKTNDIFLRRQQRPKLVNYLSYRNHLYFLLKNEFLSNLILYSPWIFAYELKKLVFGLFFEKSIAKGFFDFLKSLPLTLKKRYDILSKSKIKASDIRKWLN